MAEEVPLIKDVGYADFDNANYEVSIDQNNHYQPVRTVEDDAVLGQAQGEIKSNDLYQSLGNNEPMLNCPITDQLPTESKIESQELADSGKKSNSRI